MCIIPPEPPKAPPEVPPKRPPPVVLLAGAPNAGVEDCPKAVELGNILSAKAGMTYVQGLAQNM